jgi:hypothetical protein
MRRSRARPLTSSPRGRFHDLASLFAQLNQRYFSGRLHQPRLGWSMRGWRAQLGCFDPGLDQIAINRRLDRASVPSFVVEYVLYHEMLHLKHPLRAARCGLEAHSLAFRREEKRFNWYDRARQFLDDL